METTTTPPTTTTTEVTHAVGTIIFRPLEAKLVQPADAPQKIEPYVKIRLGWHSGKSSLATHTGENPTWTDNIVLERAHAEHFAKLKVKDKNRTILNDRVGQVKIPLEEVVAKGRVTQWYKLEKGDQVTGEILVDVEHHIKPKV